MKIKLSTTLLLALFTGFMITIHIAYKTTFALIESQLNNLGTQSDAHIDHLLSD